jgi:protein arginine N-methyltransferase 3
MDRQVPVDRDSESDESALALHEEDGWEDAEQDQEDVKIISLFDDTVFPDAISMIEHCKTKHLFDFIAVLKNLGGFVFPQIASHVVAN